MKSKKKERAQLSIGDENRGVSGRRRESYSSSAVYISAASFFGSTTPNRIAMSRFAFRPAADTCDKFMTVRRLPGMNE